MVIAIWGFSLSYHLRTRFTGAFNGSSLLSGYGANVDAARYQIVQTGSPASDFKAITQLSSWMTSQGYDIGSRLFAILNIVTGTTSAENSLQFLGQFPVVGLLIIPILAVSYFPGQSDLGKLGVFLLALFPTARATKVTANGYHTGNIAIAYLILFMIILSIVEPRNIRKKTILLLPVTAALAMSYHTFAMIFALLITVLIVSDSLLPGRDEAIFGSAEASILLVVTFAGIGLSNGRIYEITSGITGLFSQGSGEMTAVFNSGVQESVSSIFTIRRIATLGSILVAFALMVSYTVTRLWPIVHSRDISQITNRYDRVILCSSLATPPMFVMLYAWNGLGPAYQRTLLFAIWIVVLALSLLYLTSSERQQQMITVGIVVVMIFSSVAVISQPSFNQASVSVEEGQTVRFADHYMPDDAYIFSDGSTALTMLYANKRASIAVRVKSGPEYQNRLDNIYYNGSADDGLKSVDAIAKEQSLKPKLAKDDRYLVFSERMSERGVSLLFTLAPPPEEDFHQKYAKSPRISKIYSSNGSVVYFND